MKNSNTSSTITLVLGVVITALMVLLFGGKLIGAFMDNGWSQFSATAKNCLNWYDEPTGFFFTFLIGYALVWKKQLWGSVIIMLGSILATFVNIDNLGWLMFTLPTFAVGLAYFMDWRKEHTSTN